MTEWLELHRRVPSLERDKEITSRIIALSRFLPEPLKSQEFLARFSKHMLKDPTLLLGWYIALNQQLDTLVLVSQLSVEIYV